MFGNFINFDRGIFHPTDEIPPLRKSMSKYMSALLKTQDSRRKVAAKELLRTDLLHMTHKNNYNTQIIYLDRMCLFITVRVNRLVDFILFGVVP